MNVLKAWMRSLGIAARGIPGSRMTMSQRRGFAAKEQAQAETPAQGHDNWMNDKLKPRDSIHNEEQTVQRFESTASGKQFDPSENLKVNRHYDDIPFVNEKVDPQPRNPSTHSNSENRLGTDESFFGYWGGDQKKLNIPKAKVANAKRVPQGKPPGQSESQTS